MNTQQQGIGLIEIMIAIALMAVMAIIVVPRFLRRNDESIKIMNNLNLLLHVAHNNALMTKKVHRILFNLKESTATLQQEQNDVFVPVAIRYMKPTIHWPSMYKMKHFVVKNKDEIRIGEGISTSEVWLFITPDGLTQEVTLIFVNEDNNQTFSLILNPFTVQMELVTK
jgi:type II secretory pathway pseudopilin PulG